MSETPLQIAALAGSVGGATGDLILHPIDTLKTRMQGQMTTKSIKYKGMISSFRIVLKEEGFRGLYGGLTASVLGSLTSTFVYFGVYESVKRQMIQNDVNPTVSYLISGGIADIFGGFLYVPSEVIKTRLQLQGRYNNPFSVSGHNYRNTWHALTDILRKRGFGGIYYGWGATMLRDVPFSAIQFTIYETMKYYFQQTFGTLSPVHDLVGGLTAGAVAAGGLTTPLDVVKTYLQTQARPKAVFLDATKTQPVMPYYSGVWSCARGIYQRSGVNGLFAGVRVRMMWTGAQSLIMFTVYERLVSLFSSLSPIEA
ncbi:mitochondrial carrier domain-containing protein [Gorgonomyces haynaldii]|nr:mitochondrial carrier domain-containing protein [Gorgonomyces haynaldii]